MIITDNNDYQNKSLEVNSRDLFCVNRFLHAFSSTRNNINYKYDGSSY
jgi:hypothetical protein